MPFYELFCLARPGLARAARSDLMSSLGKKVLESGGIVTDVTAHGERRLAYEIRRPGVTFGEVGFCLLAFFFFISIFASNIDWRCALCHCESKEEK